MRTDLSPFRCACCDTILLPDCPRYLCLDCDPEYHLCLQCEESSENWDKKHQKWHVLLTLTQPVSCELSLLKHLRFIMREECSQFFPSQSIDDPDREHAMKIEHYKVVCDGCECALLTDVRYCCVNCVDYDLCESCGHKAHLLHDSQHCFMKMRRRVYRPMLPFLPDVVYDPSQNLRASQSPNKLLSAKNHSHPVGFHLEALTHRMLPSILSLEEQLFGPDAMDEEYFNHVLGMKVHVSDDDQWAGKYMCHVALDYSNNTVAGYILTSVKVRENKNSSVLLGHIESIAVNSSYQRKGIGEFLMTSHLERIKQLKKMCKATSEKRCSCKVKLHVSVMNGAAQKLYSKLGFKTLVWRDNYYRTIHVDALLMNKQL